VTIQTKVLRQALSSARRSRTSWRCSAERSLRRRLQGDLPYQPCHHRQPPIAALTHIAFDARRVVDQPLRLSENRGRGCHLARRLRHSCCLGANSQSKLMSESDLGCGATVFWRRGAITSPTR
jgi:hypothetical protein